MKTAQLNQLRFPIGEFEKPEIIDNQIIEQWIQDIADFPKAVEVLTKDLTIEQLNWKYRPNGWTVKQVVHHCVDSHMNSVIRFKLALTENQPTIRPYFEDRWAELADALDNDLSDSLLILKGLHSKWVKLLKSLSAKDLALTFVHPEHGKIFTLGENIGIYAWHCNHHLEHIKLALKYRSFSTNI